MEKAAFPTASMARDEKKKGIIAKFPDELHKAYQAGIGLVKGEKKAN